ncbi:MAG: DUF115 domain-containing protein [Synergistaceae bacterium]|jgi:hypothetical protein|nr:DUF115 domain-containing protein [Synergistaceae bacterium]
MPKEYRRAPESLAVWRSNITELERRQPLLASILKEYTDKNGHEFEHFETSTPAGKWIEGLTGEPFFERGGEPKFKWSRKSKKTPLFFLYGAGVPPYLFKAIRALPDNAMSLLVIEPSVALLAYTLHMTHVYHAMPRGAFLNFLAVPETTENIEALPEEERPLSVARMQNNLRQEAFMSGITTIGIFTATQAEASVHPGEEETCGDAFKKIAKEMAEWAVIRLQLLGNSAEDTMLGLRQMALMAPWILYGSSPDPLLEPFRGRPFVVVSAGPSLEKNFDLLRDIGDKGVIMAADAVLRRMIKSGVLPHIVCVLERGGETYETLFAEVLDEYSDECSKILLMACAVCTPKIFGRWPGPKIIVGKRDVPVDKWFINGILRGVTTQVGSSVAHMNYALAAMMGASEIALTGQDLALGEDGRTHASGVFNERWEASLKEDARKTGGYMVPGALGGVVETTEVWLGFLRVLEQFIAGFKASTYDCTEGGALIAGTSVVPFADFIDAHVKSLDPFEKTPAEVVAGSTREVVKAELFELCDIRFNKESSELMLLEHIIDELEREVELAVSAGLEPKRRIAHASQAGRLIDRITAGHEMFAFVTQSYVYLASMELALTRGMETVDEIERWEKAHREIIASHRSVLAFIKKWMFYGRDMLRYYSSREVPSSPLSDDGARNLLEELREIEKNPSEHGGELETRFEIDSLLSRCDPVRLRWPGYDLWPLARFLMDEGRFEEAAAFMGEAARDFDGMEMPSGDMIAFFKDYAKTLSMNDLCYWPPYHLAENMLANAIDLAGGADGEMRDIMDAILENEVASYERISDIAGGSFSGSSKWFRARAMGERALMEGDLCGAILLVWRAIKEYWRAEPGWAASHLDWLADTLGKCLTARDFKIVSAAESVMSELAANNEILSNITIRFKESFADKLREFGADPNLRLYVYTDAAETTEDSEAENDGNSDILDAAGRTDDGFPANRDFQA